MGSVHVLCNDENSRLTTFLLFIRGYKFLEKKEKCRALLILLSCSTSDMNFLIYWLAKLSLNWPNIFRVSRELLFTYCEDFSV